MLKLYRWMKKMNQTTKPLSDLVAGKFLKH